MSNGSRRGVVLVALVLVVVAGLGVWRLRSRSAGDHASSSGSSAGGPRLVTGRGTTWMDEEPKEASGAIEGVVLDADGKPVDGARVALGRARGRNEEGNYQSFLQPKGVATSAGGGRFRIDGLIPGDYTATALHDGMTPGQRSSIEVKAKETARIEIKLGKGGFLLSGRVLDVGGGTVGGAKVTAIMRFMGIGRGPALLQVVAGGDGQYRITLARGMYGLRADAEGYAPRSDDVFIARATTKDLRVVPAARLTGRVVERSNKQPVADAEVSLTSASMMDPKPPQETKSDASGKFEFSGLEPGTYEVMARRGMLIGAGKGVGLAPAQSAENVEVELDRGLVVSGQVKDEAGAALGNIRVSASRDGPPFGQAARTRTNADGTYALEGMLPGNYRVNANEEGYGLGMARARLIEKDLTRVDITLPHAVKVSGRVVTAQGNPVDGARVQASFEGRSPVGGMTSSGEGTVSAYDGSFELRRIWPGTLRLLVRHDDLGTESFGPEEVKAGEKKVLTLVLKKGGVVAGTVRTEDGRPAPDVRITAMARETRMFLDAQDVTGPDGRYRVASLPAARITVSASRTARPSFGGSDEANQKTVTLADGEEKTGVDLVVGAAGLAIRGVTLSADGKAVPGAIVTAAIERGGRAFRGMSRDLKAYSDLDGQFALENLEKGTYTVWASHPDFPEAESIGVAASSTGLKIAFPPDTTAAGVVIGPDGKPVPYYSITLLPGPKPDEKPEDRRRRQSASPFDSRTERIQSPDGSFELRRLGPGSHELVVTAAGGQSASHLINVVAGERKAGIRIQLQPGVRITGRVVDHATGKPIPTATVSAMGRGNDRNSTEVNPDGTFALEGGTTGERIRLFAEADSSRYVGEMKEVPITAAQPNVDAGTIRLLPGNQRERFMGDASERGQIGASVAVENGRAVIRGVQPDGPAAKLGLKRGDVVLSIAGTSTTDLGNGALSFLVAGKPGDKVLITVESPGSAPRGVEVTREPYRPSPPRN
jgi:protocatechuate 3,4-dioxygenase beta subunit